ncbi:alpha/beta hydrolase [Cupriavidus sp. 30B13]|uniref:alpha/beta hydrolase n=1 Tax=Cupriavidus sp. 30B13 TaxID=3384241 RepID=UPI003CEC7BDE
MNPNLEIQDIPISGHAQHIMLRCYRPTFEKRVLPIVLYCHGGGFVAGGLDEADHQARVLAAQVGAWVVSVGYSLAPRHPFPAAPEDAYLALQWAVGHARQYKADGRRVAVAGHEAGGNIAAGVAAMARDRGKIRLAAQVLVAPLLDPSMTRLLPAAAQAAGGIDTFARAQCYRAYLPGAAHSVHPYVAPLESRRLAGLPPTLVVSAERDVARGEGEQYAGRLIAAGVPTEARRHAGACHVDLPSSTAALEDVAAFLCRHLAA